MNEFFINLPKSWSGNADDLAELANKWFRETDTIKFQELNERLVRDYVSKGILDRPERRGKEAFFGLRQLLQLIAARYLVDANWPLNDIAIEFRGQTNTAIMSFIPDQSSKKDLDLTNEIIEEFRNEAGYSKDERRSHLRKRKIAQAQHQVDITSALKNIGSDLTNVIKEEFTAFQLATWMILFVDQSRASSITIQQAEQIGRSITAALLNPKSLNSKNYQSAPNYDAEKLIKLNEELQDEIKQLRKEAAGVRYKEEEKYRLLNKIRELETVIKNLEKKS